MRLLLTTLLLTCLGSPVATAQDAAPDIVKTETRAGQFYSSQLSLDQGFPFSDIVETTGGLVFLSGLVGTDETGELVPGGLEAETHAIFRQMSTYLAHLGLGFGDVVKCLVMIDDIDKTRSGATLGMTEQCPVIVLTRHRIIGRYGRL